MKKRRLHLLLFICFIVLPFDINAKEVRLNKGEVYRDHDLVVLCEESKSDSVKQPLAIRQCQYWDEYTKKCLFEKTTFSYNELICIEECQHWDSYNNICNYTNKCTFNSSEEVYVLTTCVDFDDYSRKCRKTREEIIQKQ